MLRFAALRTLVAGVALLVAAAAAGSWRHMVPPLWFAELRRASLTSVTAWTLLVPVIGVILRVLVLGEAVTATTAIADAIVVAALVLVTYSDRTAGRGPAVKPDVRRAGGPRRDVVKEISP